MKKIECYFTADIAFSSPVCLAYCVIEFKDIHKHYCKLVTGGLWLSYLWGYVNVSQLGQSDLNPGNCSENNINMYTLKKYIPKYSIPSHIVLLFSGIFGQLFCIILYSNGILFFFHVVGVGEFPFFYTFKTKE